MRHTIYICPNCGRVEKGSTLYNKKCLTCNSKLKATSYPENTWDKKSNREITDILKSVFTGVVITDSDGKIKLIRNTKIPEKGMRLHWIISHVLSIIALIYAIFELSVFMNDVFPDTLFFKIVYGIGVLLRMAYIIAVISLIKNKKIYNKITLWSSIILFVLPTVSSLRILVLNATGYTYLNNNDFYVLTFIVCFVIQTSIFVYYSPREHIFNDGHYRYIGWKKPEDYKAIINDEGTIAKKKYRYKCNSCGKLFTGWFRICPDCNQVDSFKEIEPIVKQVCPLCGVDLDDDATFCPECDFQLVKETPATVNIVIKNNDLTPENIPASEAPDDVLKPEILFCRECGQKLDSDSAFCPDCGTPVITQVITVPEEKKTVPEKDINSNPIIIDTLQKIKDNSPAEKKINNAGENQQVSNAVIKKSIPEATEAVSDTQIFFCHKCGYKLMKDSAFCSRCGARIEL